MNGEFGIYVTDGTTNANVPKWEVDKIESFDEAKCKEIIKKLKAWKKKNS